MVSVAVFSRRVHSCVDTGPWFSQFLWLLLTWQQECLEHGSFAWLASGLHFCTFLLLISLSLGCLLVHSSGHLSLSGPCPSGLNSVGGSFSLNFLLFMFVLQWLSGFSVIPLVCTFLVSQRPITISRFSDYCRAFC